jgi:diaminohydroxyphosphoribosylaminopyrimidine deaminase/5-amino-6-(5-phosphoribosylamino)uracil reductase
VQSLLLEGGPTLATAFVQADLVDELMLFVAPIVAGSGPRFLGALGRPVRLSGVEVERVGDDVLVTSYIHEP